jgi:hypothetical protein
MCTDFEMENCLRLKKLDVNRKSATLQHEATIIYQIKTASREYGVMRVWFHAFTAPSVDGGLFVGDLKMLLQLS